MRPKFPQLEHPKNKVFLVKQHIFSWVHFWFPRGHPNHDQWTRSSTADESTVYWVALENAKNKSKLLRNADFIMKRRGCK